MPYSRLPALTANLHDRQLLWQNLPFGTTRIISAFREKCKRFMAIYQEIMRLLFFIRKEKPAEKPDGLI